MNRKLKNVLKVAFEAPEPVKKKNFLKTLGPSKISTRKFVLVQAAYIRKWVWAIFGVVFAVALIYGQFLNRSTLWIFSAMMPYLALSSIAENVRSEVYGMAELEMASRFSLKSVALARMGILGMVHFMVLCLGVFIGCRGGGASLLRTGVYLLVPYLLTDVVCLRLVRRIRGKEAVYASMGVAVIVSALPVIGKSTVSVLYETELFAWWLAALIVLGIIAMTEWKKNIDRMGEIVWNLW